MNMDTYIARHGNPGPGSTWCSTCGCFIMDGLWRVEPVRVGRVTLASEAVWRRVCLQCEECQITEKGETRF